MGRRDTDKTVLTSAGRHGAKFWEDEKNNFGTKMMQKMGWSHGQGLGKSKSGTTKFIRTRQKKDNAGIGSKQKTNDQEWQAANAVFNDLLKRLNSSSSNGNDDSTTDANGNTVDPKRGTSVVGDPLHYKTAGARITSYMAGKQLYSKFRKSKVMSNYSSEDMAAVFGRKADNSSSSNGDASNGNQAEFKSDIVTTTSNKCIDEYFGSSKPKAKNAKKDKKPRAGFSLDDQAKFYNFMSGMSNAGRSGLGFGDASERRTEVNAVGFKLTDKQPQHEAAPQSKRESSSSVSENSPNKDKKKKKKKSKKKSKKKNKNSADTADAAPQAIAAATTELRPQKKRKRIEEPEMESSTNVDTTSDPESASAAKKRKKSKKKKKRKKDKK
jgi:Pin2-interacting protein X1